MTPRFGPEKQDARRLIVVVGFLSLFGVPVIADAASKSEIPTVAVANYPLKYFAERIGGNRIKVVFPIPPDVDPAFWVPEPSGVLAFQSADAILLNGATYSKWLDRVSLPRRKLVNTSQRFEDQYVPAERFATHTHGPEGPHAHAGMAFTTWIDFRLAIQQAEAVRAVFERLVPTQAQEFEVSFSRLQEDLLTLDRRIGEFLSSRPSQPLLASHPVYDYFAKRYGLNIRSVLWEAEEFPTVEQWAQLEGILREHPAKWMLWERAPRLDAVQRLQAMGIGSVVFDPCSNVPAGGDFMTVMRANVGNLRRAFK